MRRVLPCSWSSQDEVDSSAQQRRSTNSETFKNSFELFPTGEFLQANSPLCPKTLARRYFDFDQTTFDLLKFLFQYHLMTVAHWKMLKHALVTQGSKEAFLKHVFRMFKEVNFDDVAKANDWESKKLSEWAERTAARKKYLKRFKGKISDWIEAHPTTPDKAYQQLEIVNLFKLKKMYVKYQKDHPTDTSNPYADAYREIDSSLFDKRTYLHNPKVAQLLAEIDSRQARRLERRKSKKKWSNRAIAAAILASGFESVLTYVSIVALFGALASMTGGILIVIGIVVALCTFISNYILFFDTARSVGLQLFTKNDRGVLNLFVDSDGKEIDRIGKIKMGITAFIGGVLFSVGLIYLALSGFVGLFPGIAAWSFGALALVVLAGAALGAIYGSTFFYVFSDISRQGKFGKACKKIKNDVSYSTQNAIHQQRQKDKLARKSVRNSEAVDGDAIEELSMIRYSVCTFFHILGLAAAITLSAMVTVVFIGVMNYSGVDVFKKIFNPLFRNIIDGGIDAKSAAFYSVEVVGMAGALAYCFSKAGVFVYRLISGIPQVYYAFKDSEYSLKSIGKSLADTIKKAPAFIQEKIQSIGREIQLCIQNMRAVIASISQLHNEIRNSEQPLKLIAKQLLMLLKALLLLPYKIIYGIIKKAVVAKVEERDMEDQAVIDEIGQDMREQDLKPYQCAEATVVGNAVAQVAIIARGQASQVYARGEHFFGGPDFSGPEFVIGDMRTTVGAATAAGAYGAASAMLNHESILNYFGLAPDSMEWEKTSEPDADQSSPESDLDTDDRQRQSSVPVASDDRSSLPESKDDDSATSVSKPDSTDENSSTSDVGSNRRTQMSADMDESPIELSASNDNHVKVISPQNSTTQHNALSLSVVGMFQVKKNTFIEVTKETTIHPAPDTQKLSTFTSRAAPAA